LPSSPHCNPINMSTMIYFYMEKAKIKKAFVEKTIKFSFLFQLFSLL